MRKRKQIGGERKPRYKKERKGKEIVKRSRKRRRKGMRKKEGNGKEREGT